MFSRVKNAPGLHFDSKFTCHSRQPRRNRCVFSCKMRLGFISNQNLHVTPAHPGEIVVFFTEKSALYQPPQIPCVFSSKTRLACNVPVNRVHFHCVVSGIHCVLGSQASVNSHVMLPAPPACRFFFQRKKRLAGIAGKFQSWNKGKC